MSRLKTVAFHLPQFHPTALNDELWGPGFSEWTNVVRARPLFEGHYQPKLPGALGFYDLRSAEALADQADLARHFGIDAFCFYYYRFGSQRALQKPLELFLAHPEVDMSFMYCWANEPWTRAWDGKSDETLLQQSYGEEALHGLVADLVSAMLDPRYLRIAGRPVFMIYQLEQVPEAESFVGKVREAVGEAIGEPISIGCVYSHGFKPTMMDYMDFVVQFPPHRLPRPSGKRILQDPAELGISDTARGDYFERYEDVVKASLNDENWPKGLFLGVTPDWDNSARRPEGAHVLTGSTPDKFGKWVEDATRRTFARSLDGDIVEPVLFVNAWNEWAEGAMLEPSERCGDAYLRAFRSGVDAGSN